jgi:hypothetical protein
MNSLSGFNALSRFSPHDLNGTNSLNVSTSGSSSATGPKSPTSPSSIPSATTAVSAGSPVPADELVARWRSSLREQDKILTEVLARNLELEARNKTLEYENWVMKGMLDKVQNEKKKDSSKRYELKTQIDILKSEQDSFKVSSIFHF